MEEENAGHLCFLSQWPDCWAGNEYLHSANRQYKWKLQHFCACEVIHQGKQGRCAVVGVAEASGRNSVALWKHANVKEHPVCLN